MKIRNYSKFQHFRDRRPPWIKLYRDLLDDKGWHNLSGDDAKTLTMLWLIASEDEQQIGSLPDAETLAFRLRIPEHKLKQSLTRLNKWVIQDDIGVISPRYQDDAPERETETETDGVNGHHISFDEFWNAYPRKESKANASKAFAKLPPFDQLAAIAGVETFAFSEEKKYQPHPASWLNARRWEDDQEQADPGYEESARYEL